MRYEVSAPGTGTDVAALPVWLGGDTEQPAIAITEATGSLGANTGAASGASPLGSIQRKGLLSA